jgi:DDB1- and CUL4-associated factor 13
MKIDSIYHSKEERRKERKNDLPVKKYSKDPIHHPLLLEREYVRSLNATKVERMLAKPFIAALSYHREGINKLVKCQSNNHFASSSYDNKVILWDLMNRAIIKEVQMDQIVNAIALDKLSNLFISSSKTVVGNNMEYKVGSIVNSIDIQDDMSVGSSSSVSIFDVNRVVPKNTYDNDNTTFIKQNPSFKHIMGAINAFGVKLYDNRSCREFAELPQQSLNCMDFNPKEGYMFTTGGDDGNANLYDLRNLERALGTYRGHTNAVVSIAYNPNGKEICTGSYDRTIRMYGVEDRKSRDCYYNDRMQLVHGVKYSNDGQFIISGSDDGSLRIWKTHASKKLGPLSKEEKESLRYKESLKEKFKDVGEISRISKHRFLPNELKQQMRIKHEMHEAQLRRAAKREEKKQREKENAEEDE